MNKRNLILNYTVLAKAKLNDEYLETKIQNPNFF